MWHLWETGQVQYLQGFGGKVREKDTTWKADT